MALTWRQTRLYTFRVSLYRPNALAAGGDIEATEAAINPTPAAVNVPCYYKGTPEVDVAMALGLTKELNLFTLDLFHFDTTVVIADSWVIQMTGSDPARPPHPYIGRFWVVRDNPQVVASQGAREANFQMAYAVLSHLPGLSALVTNVS